MFKNAIHSKIFVNFAPIESNYYKTINAYEKTATCYCGVYGNSYRRG